MDKLFKLKEHGTDVRTEVLAGLTTFFAMSYILCQSSHAVTNGCQLKVFSGYDHRFCCGNALPFIQPPLRTGAGYGPMLYHGCLCLGIYLASKL